MIDATDGTSGEASARAPAHAQGDVHFALALERYLVAHVPACGRIHGIEKFPGGQSNPTYRVDAAGGSFVLRRKPAGRLLPSAHAIDREFRVLSALAGTGVPVPRVHHYCADDRVIGTPFYVMDYVRGSAHWDARIPGVDAPARARIYAEMGRTLVALHAVDPAAVGLADFGRPSGYFERQVRRWTEQYRAAETEHRAAMERVIEWLPAHLPRDDGQVAIVHGDFRLDNFLFDDAGHALALLDWELSTLGHPYADLAYQCAQWRLPPGTMRGLEGVDRASIAIPTEADYVAAYCAARGCERIDHWPFYLAVSLFRLASICQGVYRRGLDGNASSADALDFGRRAELIAAHAAAIIE